MGNLICYFYVDYSMGIVACERCDFSMVVSCGCNGILEFVMFVFLKLAIIQYSDSG